MGWTGMEAMMKKKTLIKNSSACLGRLEEIIPNDDVFFTPLRASAGASVDERRGLLFFF